MPVYIPVPRVRFRRIPRPHPVILARDGLSGLGAVQVLPPATVQTIAGVIQQQEGYYPGSLAFQNNNPGNLIFAGQAGATPGAGGFARFATYDDGLNALQNQIQLYASRGLTIQGMMNVYAPAAQAGNNPSLYAANVAGAFGVSPDTRLVDLAGGAGVDNSVPASVYTDSGVVSLDSLAGVDPVLVGAGALAGGLLLYALLG